MDNFRRIFLTKDEVRQRATELTSSTADDIWIIYLPLNMPLLPNLIHFTYRNKDHTNLTRSGSDSYGAGYSLGSGNYDILLSHDGISFLWYYKSANGTCYKTYNYTRLAGSYKSSTYSYDSPTNIMSITPDIMKAEGELYIAFDITKATVVLPGSGNIVNDFVMQYKSGEIPEDTLFYEPWP